MPIWVLEWQGTIDYLGLNTYIRMKVGNFGSFMGFVNAPKSKSDMGWDLALEVLYQVVYPLSNFWHLARGGIMLPIHSGIRDASSF